MVPLIEPKFNSEFSDYLMEFIKYKRCCGFKYNREIKFLENLDKLLYLHSQSPDNYSPELIYNWLAKKENESDKTFSSRNSLYHQLYDYYSSVNNSSIFPCPTNARIKIHSNGFVPYIFTHEEIKGLFESADKENTNNKAFKRCAGPLFRLLYGTGLRINEALSLRVGDVLIDKKLVVIIESKNDDSRLVPMSSTLTKRMEAYISSIDYADDEPLFQSSTGKALRKNTVYDWFRLILWRSGIAHHGRGKGPRLHDLRHTFAVHSLQNACEKGSDPYAFLPLLSVYLGHKSLAATERYLRLTAEAYPSLTKEMDIVMNNIIPEVSDYEE